MGQNNLFEFDLGDENLVEYLGVFIYAYGAPLERSDSLKEDSKVYVERYSKGFYIFPRRGLFPNEDTLTTIHLKDFTQEECNLLNVVYDVDLSWILDFKEWLGDNYLEVVL